MSSTGAMSWLSLPCSRIVITSSASWCVAVPKCADMDTRNLHRYSTATSLDTPPAES
jgi:hypothetical protein